MDRATKQRLVLEFNNLPEIADRTSNQHMSIQTANNQQTTAIRGRPFQGMTPLETLAEVSRDMAESEHRNHRPGNGSPLGENQVTMSRGDNLELQEQYTLDNPPMSYESRTQRDKKGQCKQFFYCLTDTNLLQVSIKKATPMNMVLVDLNLRPQIQWLLQQQQQLDSSRPW